MDKTRARLKRKKRQTAEAAKRALAKEFNEHYKARGQKKFSADKISRAYDKLEKQSICEGIMTDTVMTCWVMRKLYRWGAKRLFRLACEITLRVGYVGRNERSIAALADELKYDAHFDCAGYWEKELVIPKGTPSGEAERRTLAAKTAAHVFPIHMHAVFYLLFKQPITRKSRRLDRIAYRISNAVTKAIADGTVDNYRKELEKAGLAISETGQFKAKGMSEEEFERYMRRIKPDMA